MTESNRQASTSKRSLLWKIFVVFISVCGVVVLLAGVGLVLFFAGIGKHFSDCDAKRDKLFSNYDTLLNQLDDVTIVSDQPNVKATGTKQDGDCVDSLPTISAKRTFPVDASAGALYAMIDKNMTDQGYARDAMSILKPPCAYESQLFLYSKGTQKIEIRFTCATYGTTAWDAVKVTTVEALTRFGGTDLL